MTSLFPAPDSISGLTGPQKCTIYAAWQLIKKDFQIHARNVFARFFEEYPTYLNHFNDENEPNNKIHRHSLAVFESLNLLIEIGFNDVNAYEHHLSALVKFHPNIRRDDVKNMSDTITNYLLETLEKQRTNTLNISLVAFFEGICKAFDQISHVEEELGLNEASSLWSTEDQETKSEV
ncbi:uncharacterized protein LOC134832332 [Culicoides brevitarsis]|uniref:uncharacterized protein LOC134832332 n=1 Tax=Culicoides brevitarsis TaxID=469753 RepID=UPI00307B51C9